jgi:nucleoside-diphosphate-sugar epimerase
VTPEELEEALSRPAAADVAAMAALPGDLLVLGAAGKMGPSLAQLARRASEQAGVRRRVIGVARFSAAGSRETLERAGVETIAADLLDRDAVTALPDAPNVVYMAGQKFGTSGDQPATWATNVVAASLAAERYAGSRIVAFSTGNVYPLTTAASGGPVESDPTGPIGEYAQSALGRERILEFQARRSGTPLAILRLNYAIEPRYGVLRDLADKVWRGEPIDVTMGHVNIIWQRDANAIALRALAHGAVPPLVLNVTGPQTLAVRDLATRLGAQLGRAPEFTGTEQGTALLSNAARCVELFGPAETTVDQMIATVADWVKQGGASLNKPTHFAEREGRF